MTDKPDSHHEGTDEALMVRYQRGDRNALAVVVRRYARLVYSTAYGITGTTHLATELTQNAFLGLVEQAGNFHIEMRFRSWLFGFLHQLIMEDRDTSLNAQRFAGQPEDAATAEATEPDAQQPASRSARSQLLSRRISECTARLPLLEREVLVMKLTAQLTLAELAVAIATDGETVRTRLRSALERLRESVSDTEDYARALR
jgi:RNA polymerase sigma-70 factor, ECF subfamily